MQLVQYTLGNANEIEHFVGQPMLMKNQKIGSLKGLNHGPEVFPNEWVCAWDDSGTKKYMVFPGKSLNNLLQTKAFHNLRIIK